MVQTLKNEWKEKNQERRGQDANAELKDVVNRKDME